ncbi:hypothetical protein EYR05_10330 [Xanthomonas oryzae pv. oryzae]|nr:hypothetical protein EYR02_10245 [Xanthomonas oryzae pv. oryzae]QBI15997.1 hypothetical protein EYR03_10620 [Xanthomonas oryzae pv. oryzae]TAO91673.1 hypothetical protein EYR05_10330 [Xanthomonas oryzae pv. oryzae]TAP11991.1 hypothetical protein EYR04_12360 [Xanthomonas oryzae pv. oryzae]
MAPKIPSGPADLQLADAARRDRHRLFWRWHLYAGLFVAPFLLMLAVTGAIYLFNDALNDAIYQQLRNTPAPWKEHASLGRMIDAAQAHVAGSTATRIDVPTDPQRPAHVYLDVAKGPNQIAFVDPGNARVPGTLTPSLTLVGLADRLHGSLMLGTPGCYLIELASCWAVLLILSGLYLGWPRGQGHAWWHGLVQSAYQGTRVLEVAARRHRTWDLPAGALSDLQRPALGHVLGCVDTQRRRDDRRRLPCGLSPLRCTGRADRRNRVQRRPVDAAACPDAARCNGLGPGAFAQSPPLRCNARRCTRLDRRRP